MRACPSGLSAAYGISTPMRLIRSGCCARAASGHAAAAPPSKRYEFATFHHSITSSARASSVAGISRPSAFAVLRLITSSYMVGA